VPSHPLDPLTSAEIRSAVAILRREQRTGPHWRIGSVALAEPPKAELLSWREGGPVDRRADVVCWDPADPTAFKATVALGPGRVENWQACPGAQPSLTPDEWRECDEALRHHPQVMAALARRGITDPDLAVHDVWAYPGFLVPERYAGRRVGWTDTWHRTAPGTNPYANPVGGLHAIVDLNRMELLELEEGPAVPVPPTMGEYDPAHVPGLVLRGDLKPLEIHQPEGASFQINGHQLSWQRWSMRIGFNHREGLVLHQLAYDDGGRSRPVAHRMSIAEMIVPYRDPSPDHARRIAYDIGEWGLGFMTTSLERGCDCLGEIAYLDAVLNDSRGEPVTIPHAICVHEEDNAVLWKHVDARAGTQVRRMRRLVVSWHVTVANYEYLLYWRFYQDGSIEFEVRATGILVTSHFAGGQPPPFGAVVDQGTYAPFHQHFLVARLDLDIDGQANTVYRSESEQLPASDANPHGLGLIQRDTPLRNEAAAREDYRWETQRSWKVVNPGASNAMGQPPGYKLVPGGAIPPLMAPGDPVRAQAPVIGHTLWVTRHDDGERWPCGEFPTEAAQPGGLPVWTAQDRPLEGADVVLWYVFGIHHIPRPEDWPVMPADVTSFWLKPAGFFDRNPALDVAPQEGH
jgi:primary-amine oxidase